MHKSILCECTSLWFLHVSIGNVYKLSTLVFTPSSYVIRTWIANYAMCMLLFLPMSDDNCSQLMFSFLIVPTLNIFFLSYLILSTADACFMTIHVVIPSSGHRKSPSGERYLNYVYELCNLLQFKHDVSYISVALMIMVMLLKCNLPPTQRHFTRLQKLFFRVGLWQFRIKHNSFTIFTLIPNNSMKESSRVFELLFFACVITVKKINFQSKKYR